MSDKPDSDRPSITLTLSYRPFLLVMLVVALALTALILRPFAEPIIMAIMIASLFFPAYTELVRVFRGREIPAALAMVALIIFVIILPLLVFLSALLSQGADSLYKVSDWLSQENLKDMIESPRIVALLSWATAKVKFIDFTKVDLQSSLMTASQSLAQALLSRGAGLVEGISMFVAKFFIMIFITFYFLKDGRKMIEQAKRLSPLPSHHEEKIIEKVRNVVRSVVFGSFLTAVCQGLVGGIGLAIVGIPALFWGTIMAIASLIPMVGTALVWVPAVIYLVLFGKIKAAIFLTVYCVTLVGSIDNFLRPYFMKGGAEMSPFYIFLAIIGGIQVFGLAGILYGPLIFSFAAVMLYIYSIEYEAASEDELE